MRDMDSGTRIGETYLEARDLISHMDYEFLFKPKRREEANSGAT